MVHTSFLIVMSVVLLSTVHASTGSNHHGHGHQPPRDSTCSRQYWTLEGLNANWASKYFSGADNRTAVCSGSAIVFDPVTYAVVDTFALAPFEVSEYYDEAKGCYATLALATNTLQEEYGRSEDMTRTCLVQYSVDSNGTMVEDTNISGERFKTPWPLINGRRWVERDTGRMTNLEFIFFHGPRTELVESLYLMSVDPETQGPTQLLMVKCVTAP
jgi:hypothetical protein